MAFDAQNLTTTDAASKTTTAADAASSPFGARENMVSRRAETWRPPLLAPPTKGFGRFLAAARRFLDLQAGSIWNDLAGQLPLVDGAVVDVGCGAQPYRNLLPPGATYVGIDAADAESHFGYSMPDTRYFSGSTWPVADGAADLLLCTETMEHVPDPAAFLAEAARCTRPGGRLLLTVPFAARWHFIPHDYWRFTPSSLNLLLTQAGFGNVAVYARGNRVTVACYKVMALILPMLFPAGDAAVRTWVVRFASLPLVPLLLALACVGNVSLRCRGGDDCLGYTVLASRSVAAEDSTC